MDYSGTGLPEAPRLHWLDAPGEDRVPESAELETADVLLTWRTPVGRGMIEQARRCMLIVVYGPGNGAARIDLDAARQAGIYVASLPDYASEVYAARAWGLLEAGLRETGREDWKRLRLGLVGLGQVGRRVAQRARAAGARVWACDPFAEDFHFTQLEVARAELPELFGLVHAVTLHVPLGPATRGMIGADALSLMPAGAVLVNTSQAGLVQAEALAAGLAQGRPGRALMDDHEEWGEEAARNCRRLAEELIRDFWGGQRPPHLLIDPPCPRHVLALAGQGW